MYVRIYVRTYIHTCYCWNDIVEAHCYVVITNESILMSKYVCSRNNQSIKPLIAGRFSHIGLRQLSAKRFAHQDRLSNWNCLNLLCTCLHICNWYPPTKSVFDYSSVTHVFLPMCACMYVCMYVRMYVEDHLVHAVLWCPLVGDWAFLSLLAAGVETTQVAGSTDSSPAGPHSQVCVVCAWCVWCVLCAWCVGCV